MHSVSGICVFVFRGNRIESSRPDSAEESDENYSLDNENYSLDNENYSLEATR